MTMTSHRPYMIRALHEWILDNNFTPYILVNAFLEGVEVPQDYVKDGQIVLNISPQAIKTLNINNAAIEFEGRFGGIPTNVYAPMHAIMSIYARENGQGMVFESDEPVPEPPAPISGVDVPSTGSGKIDGKNSKGSKGVKPSLRVVK
ncbi:ClpXP protease specificity-enhancing factor [Haliea sp. AH-315-K21]|uniref:ClpXP protease specificity-enhancing factor n=1 Tax=SAR86 cluster bacterium TaxID=2030880 RepID=A0A2A5CA65_9GAMM|nr:ClpXP protease specificity-enhancing factor [Haliea sp. AH-315-K21]PCJ40643.1 MAG: ClpXP protease specificity-enhancing factor [SAR86 cluster bacterium]